MASWYESRPLGEGEPCRDAPCPMRVAGPGAESAYGSSSPSVRVDGNVLRGIGFAFLFEAILFGLIYCAVMLPHWAGWLQ